MLSADFIQRGPALILLLLLVVVAGVYLVWTGDNTRDVGPDTPEMWLEDDPVATAPNGMKAIEAIDDEPASPDTQPPEGLLQITRKKISAPGNTRPLVVQVWERKKGVPAVDADVFMLDGFGGAELQDPFGQHWSDLAENRGQRFKTDLNGRAVFY